MEKDIMVTRPTLPSLQEYIDTIRPLWENHWITNMGQLHQELEKKLKEYLQVPRFSLFVNGHMALELTLQAFELTGEVITTPFTFASTTHAIVRNGLTPVFCDIKDDYTINENKIEALITDKTSAILPVHVYGNVCNVEVIQRIANKYDLKVIYDGAQAFGVKKNGVGIGNFGDATIFSFHATKVFHTIEGGGVAFRKKELEKSLYELKNFGILGEEEIDAIGANAKMNEFQAAMGLCNLKNMNEVIEKRRILVEIYRNCLGGVKGIRLNQEEEGITCNYAYFPVWFDERYISRDEVYDILKEHHIYARKYFYPLTSQAACYQGRFLKTRTPRAVEMARGILALPLFADLKAEQILEICSIVLSAISRKKVV